MKGVLKVRTSFFLVEKLVGFVAVDREQAILESVPVEHEQGLVRAANTGELHGLDHFEQS